MSGLREAKEEPISSLIEDHQDVLIIIEKIETNTVKKILVDNSNLVEILQHTTYSRMDLENRKMGNTKDILLYDFNGIDVKVVGVIDLLVLFRSLHTNHDIC